MRLSLVIPAHNEERYIEDCLRSIAQHGKALHEVIVVDNASSDSTGKIASSFPGVRVVREDTKGLTYARQKGLKEAQGELVGYMDADTRMPEHWVEKVFEVFKKNPHVVAFSGPAHYWDATLVQKLTLALSWWSTAPLMYFVVGYMIYGAHFVARKDALEKIGGFDTSIAFYGEDTDIAKRLSKVGKVLFRMDFYILSSARRFAKEGFLRTNITYSMNFIWPALTGKPWSTHYRDIRDTLIK
jgi:glycosyltransferase involved in cell wall biosynthesis